MIRHWLIKRYFRFHRIFKLQLGSGSNCLEGWLNTDFSLVSRRTVFLDATKAFVFADATFDYIFSEHQIENLNYKDGFFMITECYRVLKPGGRIRIATTNVRALVGLYTSTSKDPIEQEYIRWMIDHCHPDLGIYEPIFVLNNAFYNWNHKFLYDESTIKAALELAGFVDVRRYEYGESDDRNLRGIDCHGNTIGNELVVLFETMVMEAIVPELPR